MIPIGNINDASFYNVASTFCRSMLAFIFVMTISCLCFSSITIWKQLNLKNTYLNKTTYITHTGYTGVNTVMHVKMQIKLELKDKVNSSELVLLDFKLWGKANTYF